MNGKVNGIIVATLIGILGLAGTALADWGYGCGYGMQWRHGGGGGYGMMGGPNAYSDAEMAKVDQQWSAFFKATEDLRGQLYEKQLALQSELAKENPDVKAASRLQKEISRLQSTLDQKRLDFEIRARQSSPDYNRAYRGHGPMMGYGCNGYCWRR